MNKGSIAFLVVIIFILIRGFIIEPNTLVVTRYEIQSKELSGIKIAFLTDFHLKKREYSRLNKIAKLARKEEPNLIILGGDFGKNQDYKKNMRVDLIATKIRSININAPVYAVLGESDWYSNGKQIAQDLQDNGVRVLENSNRRVVIKGRYFDIIGLADLTSRQPNIEKAFSRTRVPRIVITHNPDIYYDIMDEVTLILAGHTHGGQFVIPFASALFVPSKFGTELASGMITKNHNRMIVSKGIGTTGIPIRFNCKPEIVIVEFKQ